jgi:hypothetical protein
MRSVVLFIRQVPRISSFLNGIRHHLGDMTNMQLPLNFSNSTGIIAMGSNSCIMSGLAMITFRDCKSRT